MPENQKLREEWVIAACPACNAQADPLGTDHTGDCPNRGRTFFPVTVHVVPKPRPSQPDETPTPDPVAWLWVNASGDRFVTLDPNAEVLTVDGITVTPLFDTATSMPEAGR